MIAGAPARERSGPEERSRNSFDFVRLAAAVAVLFSHSFALYGLPEPVIFERKLGTHAVAVFFALSGYLILLSWMRDPNLLRFSIRRSLRIFPGLLIATLVTALIIGAIDTSMPLWEYLHAAATWRYVVDSIGLINAIPAPPGAFTGLPIEWANGSLWTLRYEVLMYTGLVLLVLLLPPKSTLLALFMISTLAWNTLDWHDAKLVAIPLPLLWRAGYELNAYDLAWLSSSFLGGAVLCILRERVRLTARLAAAMLAIVVLTPETLRPTTLALAIPYLAIYVATRPATPITDLRGWDISYGTYIYAFPIGQIVTRLCLDHGSGWPAAALWTLVLTGIVAALSWRLIERPSLALKHRLDAGGAR